jgi:hypothetical protein
MCTSHCYKRAARDTIYIHYLNNTMPTNKPNLPVPDGVRYARWAGHALGFILICTAIVSVIRGLDGAFSSIKASYFFLYGIVLNLPFIRISDARWKLVYGLLVFSSIAFVFVMVVSVMFSYMAAADRGDRLGVPGLEGSLIFLSLMQIPAVLFQRRPDLID